jgi:LCP family protein required for cell wall assembly
VATPPDDGGAEPERPDYKVYRSRPGSRGDRGVDPDRPDYKVYRSRPRLLSRLRGADLSALRRRVGAGGGKAPPAEPTARARGEPARGPSRWTWQRVGKWVGVAALAWIVISILAFAISTQIQSSKLASGVSDELHGNPFLAVDPQTILVLGSDVRPSGLASVGQATPEHCITAAGEGEAPPSSCPSYRSDTLLLVRAGGLTFRKLSISRDTLAEIPGHGGQKINSAYAFGGAKLTVQTLENFLGINIDHIAIVDFNGFRDFINAIGGVSVNLPEPVCSSVSGGAANGGFSLHLSKGEHTLDADQALTLARTRENTCGTLPISGTDLERAMFQQDILDGMKSRLTSITRIPYNFIHGPWIGWNAPKSFVSDMGAFTLPQLVFSSAISGSSGTDFLKPASTSAAGNLVISHDECVRAVTKFLGHAPPNDPQCSPAPTG